MEGATRHPEILADPRSLISKNIKNGSKGCSYMASLTLHPAVSTALQKWMNANWIMNLKRPKAINYIYICWKCQSGV